MLKKDKGREWGGKWCNKDVLYLMSVECGVEM